MANVSVVLVELAEQGPEAKERFATGLQDIFHVPESKAWQILATLPAVLSKSVPEEDGRVIADKIRSIGGICRLQPLESADTAPDRPAIPPSPSPAPVPEPPAKTLEAPMEALEAPEEDVDARPEDLPRVVELRRSMPGGEMEGSGAEGRNGEAAPGEERSPFASASRPVPGPGEVRCPLCGAIQSVANRRCASCFQWLPEATWEGPPAIPAPREAAVKEEQVPPVAAPVSAPRRPSLSPAVAVVSGILLWIGAAGGAWSALAFPRVVTRWMLAVAVVDLILALLVWMRPAEARPVLLVRGGAGLLATLWLGVALGAPFLLQMHAVLGAALLVLGIGGGSLAKAWLVGLLGTGAICALALAAGVMGTPASISLSRVESGMRRVEERAYDRALRDLHEALSMAPSSRPDIQAKARVGIASARMGKEEFLPAVAELEEAIRLDPANAEACFLLAACHIHEGRPADAERMLARVRELNPEYPGLQGLEEVVRRMPR